MTQLAPFYKPVRSHEEMTMTQCIVCGSENLKRFITVDQVPVQLHNLWPSQNEALEVPKGKLELTVCLDCGHIFNAAFDSSHLIYDQDYENSLHFSPRFQAYAEALAKRLVNQYSLREKHIVEIGSGKGDFLKLVCNLGDNWGVGFDPSFGVPPEKDTQQEKVRFIRGYYSNGYSSIPADLVCSRHTLEHLEAPGSFVDILKHNLRNQTGSVVYLEVPDVFLMLTQMSVWDFIYEHVSYFSPHSLGYLLDRAGFQILDIREPFEGQFLSVEARLAEDRSSNSLMLSQFPVEEVVSAAYGVASKYHQMVKLWKAKIEGFAAARRKVVLWGAGSKGISFLNALRIRGEIPYVVDINPRKRGMFITGSGQEIVQPEFLKEYRPDTILIMNPIYKPEIESMVQVMGLKADILTAI